MKKLLIKRFKDDGKQTQGRATLFDGDKKILDFVTLEPPWLNNQRKKSCIPAGNYKVKRHLSPTKGDCFLILGTEPRTLVLIHIGNYAASKNPRTKEPDTEGCILVGKRFADINGDGEMDITSSKVTLEKLLHLAPEGFILEIVNG